MDLSPKNFLTWLRLLPLRNIHEMTIGGCQDSYYIGLTSEVPLPGALMPTSKLFSQFRLRNLELPNRIVVSPMAQYSADRLGRATAWHLMHLGNFAVSGVGLLMTEQMAVEPEGRLTYSCSGLWSDDQVSAMRPVFEFCRRHGGAKLGIQLGHAGRKGSVTVPWEGQVPLDRKHGAWPMPSSSLISYPGRPRPTELDGEGLARLRDNFVQAARNSLALDADLLELHCAHGYLLHSFLTPLANQRTDRYGGSTQARIRFPLEVFDAIREVWASDRPLGVRVSATDWTEGGWTADDSVEFAAALKARGCDYICASSGGASPDQRIPVSPGYQVPFADLIHREVGIPTMALGLITEPRYAEQVLSSGQADLIALGRGMLYNPRWAWHAAQELGEESFFPPQYQRAHPSMRSGDFLRPFKA